MKLYYFENSTPNMGHIPFSTISNVDFSFNVEVDGDEKITLDGVQEKDVYFENGKKYAFKQDKDNNKTYKITFAKLESNDWVDDISNVIVHGTPGQPDAYTIMTGNMDFKTYFLTNKADGQRLTTQVVPTVYTVSVTGSPGSEKLTLDGVVEKAILFEKDKKYLFKQEDGSNATYKITFPKAVSGAWVDDSSNVVEVGTAGQVGGYTVYKGTGDFREYFLTNSLNQRLTSRLAPYVYTVSVNGSGRIVVDGVVEKAIAFSNGNRYIFKQEDATNANYKVAMGKISSGAWTNDGTNIVNVGTPGQSGAYTIFTANNEEKNYFLANSGGTLLTQRSIPLRALFTPISGNVPVNKNQKATYYFPKGYGNVTINTGGRNYTTFIPNAYETAISSIDGQRYKRTMLHATGSNQYCQSSTCRIWVFKQYLTLPDLGAIDANDSGKNRVTYTTQYVTQNLNGGLGSYDIATFTNVAVGSYVALGIDATELKARGLDFTKSPMEQ